VAGSWPTTPVRASAVVLACSEISSRQNSMCGKWKVRRIPAAPRTPEMIQRDHPRELRVDVRLSTHGEARRLTGSAPHNASLGHYVTLHDIALRCIHLQYHYHYHATGHSLSILFSPLLIPHVPVRRAESSHSAVSGVRPLQFYINTLKVAPAFLFSPDPLPMRQDPSVRHLHLQLFDI
jgi:hypothetical protein